MTASSSCFQSSVKPAAPQQSWQTYDCIAFTSVATAAARVSVSNGAGDSNLSSKSSVNHNASLQLCTYIH